MKIDLNWKFPVKKGCNKDLQSFLNALAGNNVLRNNMRAAKMVAVSFRCKKILLTFKGTGKNDGAFDGLTEPPAKGVVRQLEMKRSCDYSTIWGKIVTTGFSHD